MRTPALLIAAAAAGSLFIASADTTETYDFTGFDELDIAAGVSVLFETGAEHSIIAEFEKGGPEDLKVRQSGDRLYIARKNSNGWGEKVRVKVFVSAPSLEAIEASSGSSLKATDVNATDMDISVSSGASINITGTCTALDISASSGGSANAGDFVCSSVKASANSGGSARAHATDMARSNTSSGGSVTIYGDPADRKANKSMSGGSTRFK